MTDSKKTFKPIIIMNHDDNVAVALRELAQSEKIKLDHAAKPVSLTLSANIPLGHKVAIKIIRKGDKILKYGKIIGTATTDIAVGEHVHNHNITDYERNLND